MRIAQLRQVLSPCPCQHLKFRQCSVVKIAQTDRSEHMGHVRVWDLWKCTFQWLNTVRFNSATPAEGGNLGARARSGPPLVISCLQAPNRACKVTIPLHSLWKGGQSLPGGSEEESTVLSEHRQNATCSLPVEVFTTIRNFFTVGKPPSLNISRLGPLVDPPNYSTLLIVSTFQEAASGQRGSYLTAIRTCSK